MRFATYCHFAVSIYHVNIRDRNDRFILCNILWSILRFPRKRKSAELARFMYRYSFDASLSGSMLLGPERHRLTISFGKPSTVLKGNVGKIKTKAFSMVFFLFYPYVPLYHSHARNTHLFCGIFFQVESLACLNTSNPLQWIFQCLYKYK